MPALTRLTTSQPLLLAMASHPRLGLLTAAAVTGAAALDGREPKELGLVFGTVLVGQAILGWHNDYVDRKRDAEHDRSRKPLADGRLDEGTVGFVIASAVLLVVPLAVVAGTIAGAAYLASVLVGMFSNLPVLRRTAFSWLPWAASYALLPAYLSYGGWGGDFRGDPPTYAITAAAAALGVGVHFVAALPGLVDDNKDNSHSLPLRVALKTGAPRLLLISTVYTVLAAAAVAVAAITAGLHQ